MTATLTRRPVRVAPTVAASILDERCTTLATEPTPDLDTLRYTLAAALRVGRVAAIATNLTRLRDELDRDVQDLYDHMEALDAELTAYMWAHLTLGLTEADVLTYCANLFNTYTGIADYLGPRDVATIRTRLAGMALAALQGWSARLARTAATR
ncbi:hypothetical protein ACFWGN_16240 [Oerskovia sp. NPDC060338]|uniref:hypothetical protein n=1 Tax=Oerskovia sp. NPDC060338 TaxID=3347100 RepID=UPI003648AD49